MTLFQILNSWSDDSDIAWPDLLVRYEITLILNRTVYNVFGLK